MNGSREPGVFWGLEEPGHAIFNVTGPFQSGQHVIDHVLNVGMIILLIIVMMSLGCTMDISKIKHCLLRPKGIGIALLAQYGIMPLAAFCLSHIFYLGPVESVAVLICGCCPGGNLSNIFSLALKGDMNLSIVMTVSSTALALGMMPLLLYIYCLGIDIGPIQNAVPYGQITISLTLTVFPCAVGIFVNSKWPQYSRRIIKKLLATAMLMPAIGYILGYAMSTLCKLSERCKRTVCMETGCQNIHLCLAILKVAFPPEVIGALFLFPIIYLIFQVLEGFSLVLAFRLYHRIKTKDVTKKMCTGVDGIKDEDNTSHEGTCTPAALAQLTSKDTKRTRV
ncbi:hepatic sodium/bile acid cotransporter isoform X2 [Ascaphus truei]|uniref:hepatic sodium/bile acid cotransporter isoform X2 n=1 Tax=Ascaphus truei TaxID=8439 RepID=UPI003F5A4CBE